MKDLGHPLEFLLALFRAGVAAASPARCLEGHLPESHGRRVAVIACGKAAEGMAQTAHAFYGPDCGGLVVRPQAADQVPAVVPGFETLTAAHPVPDADSVRAAQRVFACAQGLSADTLLLFLVSGGASSLLCLPVPGVTLEEKRWVNAQLLACGATIEEINCVRKHLSGIKGGRLAAATNAAIVTLAISDIPSGAPALIGSGPTLQDRSTLADAREVLDRYGIEVPPAVAGALDDPSNESPDVSGRGQDRVSVVARGMTALDAAAARCKEQGIAVMNLGDGLEGDARKLAQQHAALALELEAEGRPVCVLSGGETTVRISAAPGAGGRNTEYALALALELDGNPHIWAIAADTDGIDGVGGHSGAQVDPATLKRGIRRGIVARDSLRHHDTAGYFRKAGGLVEVGATGTNVNDFRAILILPT